jgi:hypothetical protein
MIRSVVVCTLHLVLQTYYVKEDGNILARGVRWEITNAYKILIGKEIPRGRLRCRSEYDVEVHATEVGYEGAD